MGGGVSPLYPGLGGIRARVSPKIMSELPESVRPLAESMGNATSLTLGRCGLANKDFGEVAKGWYNKTWLGKRFPIK